MTTIDTSIISRVRFDGRLDVVRLANELGLKVRPIQNPTETENAHIRHEQDLFVIYVNPNQSTQRQRFSIAHELGHYEYHKEEIETRGQVDRDSEHSLDKEQERLADQFAVELLMPEDDVRAYVERSDLNGNKVMDKKAVEELARRYDVSLYAMILRLRELKFYVPYIDVYA